MLPVALTRYFADSRLEIDSFSSHGNTLELRIEKEIGPETGIITFRQTSFLSLPTLMPGESIRCRPVLEAGPEFWSICRLERSEFEANDLLFELESQDGSVFYVVGKSLEYKIVSEQDLKTIGTE